MTIQTENIAKKPEIINILESCACSSGHNPEDTFVHPYQEDEKNALAAWVTKNLEKGDYIICRSGDVILKNIDCRAFFEMREDAKTEVLKNLKNFAESKGLNDVIITGPIQQNRPITIQAGAFSTYGTWSDINAKVKELCKIAKLVNNALKWAEELTNVVTIEHDRKGHYIQLSAMDSSVLLPLVVGNIDVELARKELASFQVEMKKIQQQAEQVKQIFDDSGVEYSQLIVGESQYLVEIGGDSKIRPISQAKSDAHRYANMAIKKAC